MNITDFLPASPFEGPPLPRFLGVKWNIGSEMAPEPGGTTIYSPVEPVKSVKVRRVKGKR